MVKARGINKNMNVTANRARIELIFGSVATLLTAGMCTYASVAFRTIYDDMYGAEETFALVTRIALTAYVWCPILLGGALAVFIRLGTRPPERRKPFGALMALNLLVTLFAGYGFFEPLLRTTFHMGLTERPHHGRSINNGLEVPHQESRCARRGSG